jgi:hypothetical protein
MAAFYDRFSIPIWIFAGLVAILLFVVARYYLSGWPLLAQRFRDERPAPEFLSYFSLTFRYVVHYKLDISLASDPTGLYFAFSPALGRPHLFIPWDEIEFLPRYNWSFQRFQPVRLGSQERVRCVFYARHMDLLLGYANRLPIEKVIDLGFGLRAPKYTTPPTPAPVISSR